MPANDLILDKMTRYAVALEKHKTAEVRKTIAFLEKQVIPGILRRLEQSPDSFALQVRLQEIQRYVKAGYAQLYRRLKPRLQSQAKRQAKQFKSAIESSVTVALDVVLPADIVSVVTTDALGGRTLQRYFGSLATKTANKVGNAIKTGIVSGDSTPAIVKEVQGILKISKDHAKTLVRTSMNHVSNEVQQALYDENKDVIAGWEFVATLDARTSAICQANDGKFFENGKGGSNVPPLHMNCRSFTIPILKDWKGLGIKNPSETTRASLDGQVPARQTFGEWIAKQPRDIQDAALGKGKAELFRQGKIEVSQFVNSRNRPLTLKELRSKAR